MRVGSFSVYVPEGRERDTGHVALPHGTQYRLTLASHHGRRCDAEVLMDGKPMGVYRLDAGRAWTLERAAHDHGKFTFFKADSPEADAAAVQGVPKDLRGLIQVTFRVEKARQPVVRPMSLRQHPTQEFITRSAEPELMGAATPDCAEYSDENSFGRVENTSAGITGLTGHSDQQFTSVAGLDYDPAEETTITLRLICAEEPAVRPLTPALPRANHVPAPVQ